MASAHLISITIFFLLIPSTINGAIYRIPRKETISSSSSNNNNNNNEKKNREVVMMDIDTLPEKIRGRLATFGLPPRGSIIPPSGPCSSSNNKSNTIEKKNREVVMMDVHTLPEQIRGRLATFGLLPRGSIIPPSGPSKRHNQSIDDSGEVANKNAIPIDSP